ncbi:HD domain-containing phosphohydrolase [Rhodoferax sp.]|uniref:HD-GYP domain-containing protein n=1 Tax=Rhodoferax sp. TaxID=50421 RepID=UPI002620A8E6|nr:HD domain-containing phosphohydrolase [Rhodoferax sp.]MDD2808338.1 HD domain-containing protein [Rhodoferax sp.]MDD4944201.1 HD domain-containing protein [Rhodoferax sp.]
MNHFQKRTAKRIAGVSLFLACFASPMTWYIAREHAEQSIVSLAIEESGRMLHRYDAVNLDGPDAKAKATEAAKTISGGIFDIVEIYDTHGIKLASASTTDGKAVESRLVHHGKPNYPEAFYRGTKFDGGLWVLRVFVPLRDSTTDMTRPITGYFEGVRVMPEWQQSQIFSSALASALMAGLAALLCGMVLYPVVVHLSADNERKAREVLDSHISMMEALGRAIAKRDSDTGAHNYRVAWIAAGIAEKMGFEGNHMQALIAGSFLHDVGKIGIPDAILLKPGKLDEAEMTIMRTHVNQGKEIVTGAGWLDGANDVVASHHEKWNGSGYPQQLTGDAIPLSARIFAVADVFDALCSKRPYKEPMSFEASMAILDKDTGSHFDPGVMAVFKPMARAIYDQLASCDEEATRQLLQDLVKHHFGQ